MPKRKYKKRKTIKWKKEIIKKVGKERKISFPTIKKVVKAFNLKDAINKLK